MKRKSLLFLAMTLVLTTVINLFAGIAVFAADGDAANEIVAEQPTGEGTSENPYQITEAGHLVWINNNLTAHYKLMNDIDLGNKVWTPIGGGTGNNDAPFSGVFDGNGKKISNFKLEDNATYHYQLGFFAKATGGTIKNVTFANASMTLDQGTSRDNGFIVGYAGANSTISSCAVDSTVTITVSNMTAPNYFRLGAIVGGLVGENAVMEYCKNSANITVTGLTDTLANVNTRFDIGGMVAILGGRVSHCINEGDVLVERSYTTKWKYRYIGGIVGAIGQYAPNSGNMIEDSINYGDVKFTNTDNTGVDNTVGGILGSNVYNLNDNSNSFAYKAVIMNGNFNFGELAGAADTREGQLAGRIYGTTSSIVRTNYGDATQGAMFGGASNTSWSGGDNVELLDTTTMQNMPAYKAIVAEVSEHLTGISTDLCGYQTSAEVDGKYNLRMVATISGDYTKCQNVGFEAAVTYTSNGSPVEKTATKYCTNLYTAVKATDKAGTETTDITAETLGGDYIFVLVCKNLPADATNVEFTITTFYTDAKGNQVNSEVKSVTITPPGDNVTPAT